MPKLFATGNKVFVEGENPDNAVPLGEDSMQVLTEGQEGAVASAVADTSVFAAGEDGVIVRSIQPGEVFTVGQDPAIPSVIDPFEVCRVTIPCPDQIIIYGELTQDQMLTEWTQGKDYQPIDINYDVDGNVTDAVVKWPDDSAGFLTMTNWNATHETWDGYNITHTDSGKTVTQAAVTRNSEGAITYKPPLVVT